jgi:hypothetical protein
MSLDRRKQFVADGYERVAVQTVALPHTVWKVDLDIEFDRPLTLAEETVLRLVDAGVSDPGQMSRLMGVDAAVVVPDTIVKLLTTGLLGQLDALTLMPLGRQALGDQRARGRRAYEDVEVRYDPYNDIFTWVFDGQEIKDNRQIREAGYSALPLSRELTPLEVEVRHGDLQSLLDRFGLPFDSPDDRKKTEQRDIVRLKAKHSYPAWRTAEVEVWYNAEREDWQWRLLYRGGEDPTISEALRQLQAAGVEIIPLEQPPPEPGVSEVGTLIQHAVVAATTAPRTSIIQTEQHRAVLQEAVLEARTELIVVSPWVTTAAVDGELVGWFEQALARSRELRIVVGYGIEQDTGRKVDWKARDQRAALKRLNAIGQRYRGRLRTEEIGYTHEKVVICDRRYAIITSFNWLSFNPQPGKAVRRETGTRVEDKAAVEDLRGSLADALKLAL